MSIPEECATRAGIRDRILSMASVLEALPGVAIVNDAADGSVIYMCEKGRRRLAVTLEELQAMGTDYHARFFNLDHVSEYLPSLIAMMQRNEPEDSCTFFQQVRLHGYDDWQWHLSASRVFLRDVDGMPLAMLTLAQHITTDLHVTRKVDRLLDELTFIRGHGRSFSGLGIRERDVLRLMALGRSSREIAEALSISIHTVHTHRKNIRRKLTIRSADELHRYARAFDLI